jgi:Protein of unknown function (DUF3089)
MVPMRPSTFVVRALAVAAAAALSASSCACAQPPAPIAPTARYDSAASWLCLPGRDDACARNVDATEIRPDLTRVVVRDTRAQGADKVDCFWVYPTVDLRLGAANHEDFSDLEPIARTTAAQVARFRNVCTLYAPLYRQITIGTYLRAPEVKRTYTAVAEADVDAAFEHYLRHYNGGRKIVLLGHSQGGEMVVHLLQRYFDGDAKMRERLLLAMPIGWPIEVPKGRLSGGTLTNIPMCTQPGETACIVAYRSHAVGTDVASKHATPSPGHESVCVSPAELAHGAGKPFSRALLPTAMVAADSGLADVATPFVLLRDFYGGTCVDGPDGMRYLAVTPEPAARAAGDARKSPIRFSSLWLRGAMGLHILDFQFAQGDLVDLVAQRAAALP